MRARRGKGGARGKKEERRKSEGKTWEEREGGREERKERSRKRREEGKWRRGRRSQRKRKREDPEDCREDHWQGRDLETTVQGRPRRDEKPPPGYPSRPGLGPHQSPRGEEGLQRHPHHRRLLYLRYVGAIGEAGKAKLRLCCCALPRTLILWAMP